MTEWQKEVQKSLLASEEAAIKELEKQYARALRDINEKVKLFQADIGMLDQAIQQEGLDEAAKAVLKSQRQSKIYQQDFQKSLRAQISAILDKMQGDNYSTIDSYLKQCYEDGFIGTMYEIHNQGVPIITPIDQAQAVKAILTDSKVKDGYYKYLGVNVSSLKKKITQEISRGIASGLSYAEISRNLNNASKSGLSNAKRITRTEGHRIQQTSAEDARRAAAAKGADVVKQWSAALDSRTRPSHRRVDGEIRELDEKFSNGLMFPGEPSGRAEEVINCRCVALTRAKWSLDEAELKTLQERADYFGLDKTKNFEDYQKKYLKATKNTNLHLEKAEKISKMELGRFNTTADPMREVTGAGMVSHPEEIQSILAELKEYGVEVKMHGKDMAYSPGLFPGMPGQFLIDQEASYSAWMHEYKHFCDDRDDGFPGMRIFQDTAKCIKREVDAYNVEIEFAKAAGRPDIVERLEKLKAKEVSKYESNPENN